MNKKIYIAASWKHIHAVEMLTWFLRAKDYEVLSFVENNYGEGHSAEKQLPFNEWVKTDEAERAFRQMWQILDIKENKYAGVIVQSILGQIDRYNGAA